VFPYSERSNTTANKMPGKVLLRNRNERVQQLQILSEKKKRFFYESQLGSTQSVLWEAENNANCLFGFTENYVKVKTTYDPMLINEITKVELQSIDEEMIVQTKQLEAIF
jgi:threonylcarbamoyladenosine tRNA methylthiotransferase MtaB